MSNSYTRIGIVIIATIIATAVIVVYANIQTTLGQGSPVAGSIIMTANLVPDKSQFVMGQGCTGTCIYKVNTLKMTVSNDSKLCPSGDCRYSMENTEFSNIYSSTSGYGLKGLLKVTVVSNDINNSQFYPIQANLDKIASQEKKGQTTEFLQGSIKFGRDTSSPDLEYNVPFCALLLDPSPHVLTCALRPIER